MTRARNRFATTSLLTLLLFILFASGCGDDSPGSVVARHLELLDQRQFEEFYEMHAEGFLPNKEEFIDSLEDSFPEGAEISDIEIIDEVEERDKATVEVRYLQKLSATQKQELEATVELVKQNGVWKIAEGI